MDRRGRPAKRTSQLSASIVLYAWALEHGRPPKACECRKENGLMHWQTYYEIFGLHNFSAEIMPLVSSLVSGLRMKTCIGRLANGAICGRTIPDEGRHVHMCDVCRSRHQRSDDSYEIRMEHYGISFQEFSGAGWNGYESWVQDIDWSWLENI